MKMNLDLELESILKCFKLKKYEENKKKLLKRIVLKFVQNGKNMTERNHILNIVKNISWYWDYAILKYIENQLRDLFDNKSVLVDYTSIDKKEKYSRSPTKLFVTMINYGIIEPTRRVPIEHVPKICSEISKLFFIDDFIGSGRTIIEKVKYLEQAGVKEKKIYIISFVCHEIAEKLISEYETKNNNKYILIYSVLERGYLNKSLNSSLVKYIERVCKKCTVKELMYGWENCGTMISINGKSPNNNLSLLYGKHIDDWDSLLDRNFDIMILSQRKQEVLIDNKKLLIDFYNENFSDSEMTLKEFELLVLIYNCYGIDINTITEFHIFANLNEANEILFSLKKKKYLDDDYLLMIKDQTILKKLRNFDKIVMSCFKKIVNKRFY